MEISKISEVWPICHYLGLGYETMVNLHITGYLRRKSTGYRWIPLVNGQ